jgi:hypothetical protein
MSTVRHCTVFVLHFVKIVFIILWSSGFWYCRWIATFHMNVLPASILRVEGLCSGLDTKVWMWFGYIYQLQEGGHSESQKEGKGAEHSLGSLALRLVLNSPPSLRLSYITKPHARPNSVSHFQLILQPCRCRQQVSPNMPCLARLHGVNTQSITNLFFF